MRNDAARLPAIDALKAIACVLIVLHHLAFYGPMADIARRCGYQSASALTAALRQHARH